MLGVQPCASQTGPSRSEGIPERVNSRQVMRRAVSGCSRVMELGFEEGRIRALPLVVAVGGGGAEEGSSQLSGDR